VTAVLAGKIIWMIGVIGWFIIRLPHDRRSKRTKRVLRTGGHREIAIMLTSLSGLGIIPGIYVFTGQPSFASYAPYTIQIVIGAIIFAFALWLFVRTHKDLGRNWSVTLEVRDEHKLVTNGVYNRVRHPMYAAFWLWAVAQLFLLPNWVAGFAGIIGFGTLFFMRVSHEEQMMIDAFGDEYRRYMQRTARVVPGIY
jgi:protein-S-isoprenylcysteine O-methyltransferase Ste14